MPFSENRYHIETSQLICSATQFTGFYMVRGFSLSQSLKRLQDYFIYSGDYLRNHCLLLSNSLPTMSFCKCKIARAFKRFLFHTTSRPSGTSFYQYLYNADQVINADTFLRRDGF